MQEDMQCLPVTQEVPIFPPQATVAALPLLAMRSITKIKSQQHAGTDTRDYPGADF